MAIHRPNQEYVIPAFKMQPSAIVETVSDAIMRVLKNSKNVSFVENCCSKLKITTPIEAERELRIHLWSLLRYRQGIVRDECLPQPHSIPHSNIARGLEDQAVTDYYQHESEYVIDSSSNYIDSISIDNLENDLTAVDSPHLSLLAHDKPTLCNDVFSSRNPVSDTNFLCDSLPLLETELDLAFSESCPLTQMTSTPTEKNEHLVVRNDDYSDCMMLSDPELSIQREISESEVLRASALDNINYWDVNDMSSSWESLKLSNIPDFCSPSQPDPSLNFSKPECLNESQLMNDVDLLDPVESEISVIESGQAETPETENVLILDESEKKVDSEVIIARALSTLQDGILMDTGNPSSGSLDSDNDEKEQELLERYGHCGNQKQTDILSHATVSTNIVEQHDLSHDERLRRSKLYSRSHIVDLMTQESEKDEACSNDEMEWGLYSKTPTCGSLGNEEECRKHLKFSQDAYLQVGNDTGDPVLDTSIESVGIPFVEHDPSIYLALKICETSLLRGITEFADDGEITSSEMILSSPTSFENGVRLESNEFVVETDQLSTLISLGGETSRRTDRDDFLSHLDDRIEVMVVQNKTTETSGIMEDCAEELCMNSTDQADGQLLQSSYSSTNQNRKEAPSNSESNEVVVETDKQPTLISLDQEICLESAEHEVLPQLEHENDEIEVIAMSDGRSNDNRILDCSQAREKRRKSPADDKAPEKLLEIYLNVNRNWEETQCDNELVEFVVEAEQQLPLISLDQEISLKSSKLDDLTQPEDQMKRIAMRNWRSHANKTVNCSQTGEKRSNQAGKASEKLLKSYFNVDLNLEETRPDCESIEFVDETDQRTTLISLDQETSLEPSKHEDDIEMIAMCNDRSHANRTVNCSQTREECAIPADKAAGKLLKSYFNVNRNLEETQPTLNNLDQETSLGSAKHDDPTHSEHDIEMIAMCTRRGHVNKTGNCSDTRKKRSYEAGKVAGKLLKSYFNMNRNLEETQRETTLISVDQETSLGSANHDDFTQHVEDVEMIAMGNERSNAYTTVNFLQTREKSANPTHKATRKLLKSYFNVNRNLEKTQPDYESIESEVETDQRTTSIRQDQEISPPTTNLSLPEDEIEVIAMSDWGNPGNKGIVDCPDARREPRAETTDEAAGKLSNSYFIDNRKSAATGRDRESNEAAVVDVIYIYSQGDDHIGRAGKEDIQ